MPRDGSVTLTDRTLEISTLGLWGPNAPAVLATLTDHDLSQEGSPYGSIVTTTLELGGEQVDVALFRISYVGDTGWEIYIPWDKADARLGRADGERRRARHPRHRRRRLRHVGPDREGLPPDGRRARERVQPGRGRAGPPEGQGRRLHRQGGLPGRPRGRRAEVHCARSPSRTTPTRRVARAGCRAATSRSATSTATCIVDSHGRVSRVTTAGYGPSVGKNLLMAYLPTEHGRARHRPPGDVHERAVPRQGRRHRRPVRPRRHPPQVVTRRRVVAADASHRRMHGCLAPSYLTSVGALVRVPVCVKRVPAPGAKINVTADGLEVDAANLGFTTSPHEECAVEAAVQLIEQHGGEVTVLTLGAPEAEEQVRYARQRRHPTRVLLGDDRRRVGSAAHGRRRSPRRSTSSRPPTAPFDLILFGNESADSGGFQVGIRVAHALGRPMVNGIKGLVDRRRRRPSSARSTPGPRSTSCRCPPWSVSRRASTSLATRR